MKTPAEAGLDLVRTVRHNIRHPHYDRVCAYADRMERLVTGEGIEAELHHIISRETKTQFALRKKLFFPVVPAACAKARVPFAKVSRSQGYKGKVTASGDTVEERRKDVLKALDEFYGDESMDDFLNDRFLDLELIDPNAFVMVSFAAFDNTKEKARPFPVEVSSHQAVNLGWDGHRVSWLIGEFASSYPTKADPTKYSEGSTFVMWFGAGVWQLSQIDHSNDYVDLEGTSYAEVEANMVPGRAVRIGNRSFTVDYFEPFTKSQEPEFPGIRVGYVKDAVTKGRTFLSPLHPGINRMLETLKAGSERSLTMALVAHPQVYMYLPACKGEPNAPCSGGVNMKTRDKCAKCGGTGKEIPTSALDAMIFDLPKDASNQDLVDLARLKHYSAPDTAIIQVLIDYVDSLEEAIVRDIFTVTAYDRSQTEQTATAALIDEDSENNAVYPYARKRATAWVKLARLCAAFVDVDKGLEITHTVPENLRLTPVGVLIGDLQQAKTAGASPTIVEVIEDDIVAKQLRDQPEEWTRYQVKKRFRPFRSLPEQMRQSVVLGGQASERDRTLILQEDEVYQRCEKANKLFFTLNPDAQRVILDKAIQDIIDEQDAARAAKEGAFADPNPDPNNPDPNAPPPQA